MAIESSPIPQSHNYVYNPPTLPTRLMGIHHLEPIVGHPNADDIKAIHAAIRAVNAEAQKLSQHLFNIQMAVYRRAYPLSVFPGEHIYIPPSLPAHIPIALEPVVGTPTRDQVKPVQNVMRVVESLGSYPDLNMDLSQHLFNLQFARYIQGSTLGQFTPQPEAIHHTLDNIQVPNPPGPPDNDINLPTEDLREIQPGLDIFGGIETLSSKIVEQGEAITATIKKALGESKAVLENINRVLIATQRSRTAFGIKDNYHRVHVNPINHQGVTAAEYGLPQLHYEFGNNHCSIDSGPLNSTQIARYLKFFGIGGDLIEGQEPRLKDGKQGEAVKLIFKQIGLC